MSDSFLKIERIDAANAASVPDALPRLRSGALGALIVENVYPAAHLATLPPLLASNAPGFVVTEFPPAFHAFFYGMNLNLSDPDLVEYFAEEPGFRSRLHAFDLGGPALEPHLTSILSALDEGRPYGAVPGPEPRQRHFFTTLRAHLEGGYIPPHFDNESAMRPSYRYISALCRPEIYSFVLCLQDAEEGGALDVYDVRSAEEAAQFRNIDGGRRGDLSTRDKASIKLRPGEMVLMQSSRFLHGVSRVVGSRTRWTVCSFMALSKDGTRAYCWG